MATSYRRGVVVRIILATAGFGLAAGCAQDGGKVGQTTSVPRTLQDWVEYMQKEYAEGGIEAFQKARMSLKKNRHAHTDEWEYDVAAMVLRLGETPIAEKEPEFVADVRELAISIEANPGESTKEWLALRTKLYDCMFGNGGIDPETTTIRIVRLYSLIARGDPDILTPEERSGKMPHRGMRANSIIPRGIQGQSAVSR